MSMRNQVRLIGRTGKEVEMLNLANGKVAKTSLATTDYYTNSSGEKVEQTQWHQLVAYGRIAELMEKYVKKGKEIGIEGKITYRRFEDKEGQMRSVTEIRVEELLLLGSK
ncbi:single-stranded DNA-binding protein [Bergeyella sp. RCAD1439]|uniref:single-stranded DNA-binding protein n=1 Tax=Bergeyella anatis TaxID=3113737 RepID=UPI002E187A3C|nr:single-stranded DNA-binding protein [Bergeyella sp. RCAD1439]